MEGQCLLIKSFMKLTKHYTIWQRLGTHGYLMYHTTVSYYFMLEIASCCICVLMTVLKKIARYSMLRCSYLVFIFSLSLGLQKLAHGKILIDATLRFLHLACGYTCIIVSWRSSYMVYVIASSDLLIVSFVIVSFRVFFVVLVRQIVRLGLSVGF